MFLLELCDGDAPELCRGGRGLTTAPDVSMGTPRSAVTGRVLGVAPGVAVNPGTPVETVRDVLADIDLLLVMTVNPGFGGQSYIESSTEKIRRARALLDEAGSKAELEVDGGITAENARRAVEAGATVLVAGSAVYGHSEGAAQGVRTIRRASVT